MAKKDLQRKKSQERIVLPRVRFTGQQPGEERAERDDLPENSEVKYDPKKAKALSH